MSAALVLAATELRRFAADRTALLFLLVLPVAVIVVIGSTFSAAPVSLPIGVVVVDDSGSADAVVAALDAADTIDPDRYDSRADLDVAVRTGAVSGGIVVDGDAAILVIDQADANASTVRTALTGVLVRLGTIDAVAEAFDIDDADVVQVAPVLVERVVVDEGLGDATSAFAYTAPSNLVLFTFINSLTVGGVLVAARRSGITQRWAAAPVTTASLVGGVLLSRLGFAAIQAVLIIVIGAGLFGVSWGDPLGVAVVVAMFCLISTGTGVLAGTIARTEEQTTAIGIPLSIGLAMLGGCMWPLEVVGDTMQTIGHLTPHAWAMDAFITLIFDGGGLADIGTELAVLAGFAAALLGASTMLLRRSLV